MKTEFLLPPARWQFLTYHPLSELIAFGAGIDVNALAAHIKEHGYDEQEAIVLVRFEKYDVILDGRHRHAACVIAGVTPSFRRFTGESVEAYIAKKAHRQHLDASQRAMIAAVFANHPAGQKNRANLHGKENDISAKQAGEVLNVSERSVKDAKKVLSEGTHTLQDAVKDGTLSVSDAAKVAEEPAKVQNKAVKDVKAGKAKTATASAKPKPAKTTLAEQVDKAISEEEQVPQEKVIRCQRCEELAPDSNESVVPDCTGCFNAREQAKKNARKKKPKVAEKNDFDVDGNVIPKRLVDIFAGVELFKDAALQLVRASTALKTAEESPLGKSIRPAKGDGFAKFSIPLRRASELARKYSSITVCPDCKGDGGCPTCGEDGFVVKDK